MTQDQARDQDRRDKARRLLEAQVEFLQTQLSGDRFAELVKTEIDHALVAAGKLRLNEVVSREQIKATADKYTTLMQIRGSVPELAGQIAERLYSHRVHDQKRLGEVIDQQQFKDLVGKLLEMPAL